MEALLKEMMEHGLLIYRYADGPNKPRPKFVLHKVSTPTNPCPAITHELSPDTSVEYFNEYDEALAKAKTLVGWTDPEPEVEEGCWQGTIMYRHALGPRFEDLGTTEAADYQEAMIYFNRVAENFICEYGEELGIENSEVRVRPCQK
jgi:hypothetical protein